MQVKSPAAQDLVLVGGGHAHALVLRKLAMSSAQALRVTLISPAAFTPYSGMLPGLLAGHYSFEETHIDLFRLCQWAGVRFLVDQVEGLDPERQRLFCRERGEIAYDLLSLDIGSQPELDSVPGAREFAVPVKPVAGLWARWEQLRREDAMASGRIAVVGGGAGSVEIALAIAHRLGRGTRLALYCGADVLLQGYAQRTRRRVEIQLERSGIELRVAHRVSEVRDGALYFAPSDLPLEPAAFDTLIWCTGASAAPWLAQSGLSVDGRGFMRIEDTLQSSSHPNVFGAGDIATQINHPRPKAGVYAVRQGPVLTDNLLAFAAGRQLRRHKPQRKFLSMMALGPQTAVAERNGISLSGDWVWRWKDRIDRQFMRRFSELPARAMNDPAQAPTTGQQAPCGGCGAKVSADLLRDVLAQLRAVYPTLLAQSQALDDCARIDTPLPILQSVDALRALLDDPWRMGRIAAQHALSDLYASGAQPHSAQALITLPFAAPELQRRDLRLALAGALSVFQESGCRLVGGHSMQGPEFQMGFAVNGVLRDEPALAKHGARAGDLLVLTKALGSGALFAAHMQAAADGRDVDRALALLEQSNAAASGIARQLQAHALTDVTGFGLAGHLLEMLDESLAARIHLAALPVLPGALTAMKASIFSTGHAPNRQAAISRIRLSPTAPLAAELLFDPQTSGGLLMALEPDAARNAVLALDECDIAAVIIGEVLPGADGSSAHQKFPNSVLVTAAHF
jgi:selenide,water dikinase